MRRDYFKTADTVYKKADGMPISDYLDLKAMLEKTETPNMVLYEMARLAWAAGYDSGHRKAKRDAQPKRQF